MIEAVLFALYETLVTEFDPAREPVTVSAATRLGVSEAALGAAWRACRHERLTGRLPDYPAVLRHILAELGRQPDERVLAELLEMRLALKARPFFQPDDDVKDMLLDLRRMGVRVAVVSNCMPEEVAAWSACCLAPLVDATVFSFEAGIAKPDARIYQLACQRLGAAAAHTLFVGNGGSEELAGAEAAGLVPLRAAWFLSRRPGRQRGGETGLYPELHAPDELTEAVRGLCAG